MNKQQIPIVVVAYNRPKSLSRLLDSLKKANYPSSDIPLVISIDNGENNQDVLLMAKEFDWIHGEKEVLYNEENLGLRKHILKCGSLALHHGNVIVLEDDLYVSQNFYYYASRALAFSEDKNYIGGISLYKHQRNVNNGMNFTPIEDGFDNWYFQFASSWGQAWSAKQFKDFLTWYENNQQIPEALELPKFVLNWSEKSWLKYYIAYLVATGKFFLYPKISLTTNFSDKGTHAASDSTDYQVNLLVADKKEYSFSSLTVSASVYDVYFENANIYKALGIAAEDLCVDLYNYRKTYNKRFVLTPRILNYELLKTFGRSLKPRDANIIENISGIDYFLYDTQKDGINKFSINRMREILYEKKSITRGDALYLYLELSKEKFRRAIKKITSLFSSK
ncbi:glycosyltransferase family A protein [Muriicola sp. Z0-33]|uniref:glycosyltransferase family A protein n=1 Tax=Muriicola sp. Z0-33 TaxID=2816957 RepID=UPI002238CD84|nr:glycosyltransferase family A protein [Muriicola sp. Z0-33]MCW5515595.1 glycosyltransferase family 2 protein [Muriicola sp. Z0-33]